MNKIIEIIFLAFSKPFSPSLPLLPSPVLPFPLLEQLVESEVQISIVKLNFSFRTQKLSV